MFNTKKENLPELYELDIDVSWSILIKYDYAFTKVEDVRVIPIVLNNDGTKFKDLRSNKIYKTGLPEQTHPKMAVMQRMCSMVENNAGDQELMWDYFYLYDLKKCSLIKERLTKCHGQSFCKYTFSCSPEKLLDHAEIQDSPGVYLDRNGMLTFNAIEELLFTREDLVGFADSMEKQYKAPQRQTKSKKDVLNF